MKINFRLLIAQPDYTIEVKDLLADKKTPIFVFPTVDQVLDMIHCASGLFTLEIYFNVKTIQNKMVKFVNFATIIDKCCLKLPRK